MLKFLEAHTPIEISMTCYGLWNVCLARRVVLTPDIREICFTIMMLQVGALGIHS